MASNTDSDVFDIGDGASMATNDTTSSRVDFESALSFALKKIGTEFSTDQLKEGQRKAINEFVNRKDALVVLPTGHGKSTIYWSAPFVNDFYQHGSHCGCDSQTHIQLKSIAIVVSPLIALMKDQVAALRRENVNAVYMGDLNQQEKKDLAEGNFSLVFASPEGILGNNGTTLLSSSIYRQNVCGIFVDEGHCIAKWGYKSGKVAAFRGEYSRLAELRSFVKSGTPLFALTATASPTVKQTIVQSLGLTGYALIEESPERLNIRYSVVPCSGTEKDKDEHFEWLKNEITEKKSEMGKVLIFCKTNRNTRSLHATLTVDLSDDDESIVDVFTAVTGDTHKKTILTDFVKVNSHIRVLLVTSAFGMGINVKGLHTVFHYGSSRDIDDYFQESGRVGRDGQQSYAVLFNYNGNFGKGKTDENMRNYVNDSDKCRREVLVSHYGYSSKAQDITVKHNCCDVCAVTCLCQGDSCIQSKGASAFETRLVEHLKIVQTLDKKVYRDVDDADREIIKDLMYTYRDTLATALAPESVYSGIDIATGFSEALITKVVNNCEYIGSLSQLEKNYPFFNKDHVKKVWTIIEEIGGEAVVDTQLPSSIESSDSGSDTEIYAFATLSDFDDDDFEGQDEFLSSQFSRVIMNYSDDDD